MKCSFCFGSGVIFESVFEEDLKIIMEEFSLELFKLKEKIDLLKE